MSIPAPMIIGAYTFPQTDTLRPGILQIGARGVYVFSPAKEVRTNGRGEAVTAGYASAKWTWTYTTYQDYYWLAQFLCGGLASRRFTSAKLYNEHDELTDFTHCIVKRPTFEDRSGLEYLNVTLIIERIR